MICICKTVIPPIYESYCQKCGYKREKPQKAEVHISTKGTELTMPEEIKNEEKDKKPPRGIEPRISHEIGRAQEIFDAMKRYAEAGMIISLEWVEELEDVCVSIFKLRNK